MFYAVAFGTVALALDRLLTQVEGPWLEVLGAAVVLISFVSTWLMVRAGWRRHRENLDRRAAFWGAGALITVLLSLVAIYALVQTASFASVIAGADVHLTKPVLQSLPRPAGAKLLDERPGLAGTESVSDDFNISDLAAVVPFYEKTLPKTGWVEDKSTAGTLLVRFSQGQFVVTVAPDQATGSGDFAITVDRLSPNLLSSPSSSASASP
ncbi:MAG TPA: hypothetical protein VLS53_03805 [Candidatus Dormibacteraeota bacterium]|nr:hypothetical protein [Candidatus Dormibacteraeota bacterium]